MRVILSIEASNPSSAPASVCVAREGDGAFEVLGEASIGEQDRASDGVMLAVDRACADAGVGARDIARVVVSVGPGGFTALRIATTTAKTLAYALGCPVVPVPTPAVAGESIDAGDRPALIALAGKKDAAHLTLLRPDGSLDLLGVLRADALRADIARSIAGDGFLPPEIAARAAELGLRRLPLVLSARACLAASVRFEAVDPAALGPIYAREPDAVTQWRARHG